MTKQDPSGTKSNLYELPQLRRITGDTLRPGGISITAKAVELCAFPAGARLLDVGCGAGASLAFLRERGYMPVGMDMSLTLLEEARQYGPVLVADAHRLPFGDEVFQGVFCECVVSLLEDATQAFCDMARVLAPGGWLIISDMIRPEPGGHAEEDNGTRLAQQYSESCKESALGSLSPNSCLQGAKSRSAMESLFSEAGLYVRHIIDYRKALVEMSARMVWEFGSIEAFWELWRRHSPHGCQKAPCAAQLGYQLFVGQKMSR